MNFQIATVGPWVLLVLGVVVCARTIWNPKANWKLLLIGFCMCGVAVYGVTFLESMGRAAQLMNNLEAKPGSESTQAAVDAVKDGAVSPQDQKTLLASVMDQPVTNLNQILSNSIATAKDPKGKQTLQTYLSRLESKQFIAEHLTDGIKKGTVSYRTVTTPSLEQLVHRVVSLFEQYVKLSQSLNPETMIAAVRLLADGSGRTDLVPHPSRRTSQDQRPPPRRCP